MSRRVRLPLPASSLEKYRCFNRLSQPVTGAHRRFCTLLLRPLHGYGSRTIEVDGHIEIFEHRGLRLCIFEQPFIDR